MAISDGTPLIIFNQVDKVFDGPTKTLSKLDLTINSGECVSIIGPSGCGKSTILKLMAKLEQPTNGSISTPFTDGRRPGEVAFVFQEPTLMPWATVFENIWLPLRLQGVSRTDAAPAVNKALQTVGLSSFSTTYPNQLSGGMKMRVSIARASVTYPKVLLMDEPFAALDEVNRNRMADDLLKTRSSTGASIVLVTHNISEAVYLSDRVLVMSSGPSQILADIAISFPQPRDKHLRLTTSFIEQVSQISMSLNTS